MSCLCQLLALVVALSLSNLIYGARLTGFFKTFFDPFLAALLLTVATASLIPCYGVGAVIFGWISTAMVMLLFFLHGAKLSTDAILAGLKNWPVHLSVLASSFLLFPLLGFGVAHLPMVPPLVASGIIFLSVLPSTVQSSIAFTAIARGNVAAAVCSASLSNILGIIVTPLLVSLLMNRSGKDLTLDSIETIALQLLLPFLLGHFSRPWISSFFARNKSILGLVDRGAILFVVYSSFSAAVIQGLWHRVSLGALGMIGLLSALLLGLVLFATFLIGRFGGLSREDAIVVQFCGSKKSLISGVPMAGVLFMPAQVGLVMLPLMIFHQMQLIVCAILARHYRSKAELFALERSQGAHAT